MSERRRRRWRWRWHAYGQQLEVAALPGHATRPALVPAVPPAERRRARRGEQTVDQREVVGAVELQQTAAQVAVLQQPQQLRHPAGLCVRTRLLDCGQRDPLVWSGELASLLLSFLSTLLISFLTLSSPFSLSLSGVCLSGHPPDDLSRSHHLPVHPTHDPQHLPRALDCLAPLLWPLAPRHGGLPLLQGHHHLCRTSTQGTKLLTALRESDTV